MANHSARAGYTYEKTPEEKANEALRFKNKIASTETRAQSRVAPIAALRALASKVPPDDLKRILPPGGIHDRMSPADIESATGRIDQYHQERGIPTPSVPQPRAVAVGGVSPASAHNDVNTGTPVAAAQPQAGAVRSTATGGQEQLVQSQSGPRWVGFVNNPPPASSPAAESGGQRLVERRPIPKPLTGPTGNRATDAANLAQNRAMYAPGGMSQPVSGPKQFSYEGSADALDIAGTGRVAQTPYGTISSTGPDPGTPTDVGQLRALVSSPQTAPVTTPPSAPVVAPVATTPVTPSPSPSVGNAIRTVLPAVIGGIMHVGQPPSPSAPPKPSKPDGSIASAIGTAQTALGFGKTPYHPPTRVPNAGVPPPQLPPIVQSPAAPMSQLSETEQGRRRAFLQQQQPIAAPMPIKPDVSPAPTVDTTPPTPAPPAAPTVITNGVKPPMASAMNTVDEEEEKRRLAMSSPSNKAFNFSYA